MESDYGFGITDFNENDYAFDEKYRDDTESISSENAITNFGMKYFVETLPSLPEPSVGLLLGTATLLIGAKQLLQKKHISGVPLVMAGAYQVYTSSQAEKKVENDVQFHLDEAAGTLEKLESFGENSKERCEHIQKSLSSITESEEKIKNALEKIKQLNRHELIEDFEELEKLGKKAIELGKLGAQKFKLAQEAVEKAKQTTESALQELKKATKELKDNIHTETNQSLIQSSIHIWLDESEKIQKTIITSVEENNKSLEYMNQGFQHHQNMLKKFELIMKKQNDLSGKIEIKTKEINLELEIVEDDLSHISEQKKDIENEIKQIQNNLDSQKILINSAEQSLQEASKALARLEKVIRILFSCLVFAGALGLGAGLIKSIGVVLLGNYVYGIRHALATRVDHLLFGKPIIEDSEFQNFSSKSHAISIGYYKKTGGLWNTLFGGLPVRSEVVGQLQFKFGQETHKFKFDLRRPCALSVVDSTELTQLLQEKINDRSLSAKECVQLIDDITTKAISLPNQESREGFIDPAHLALLRNACMERIKLEHQVGNKRGSLEKLDETERAKLKEKKLKEGEKEKLLKEQEKIK